MKPAITFAAILALSAASAFAADAPTGPLPKGTTCFSGSLRDTEQSPMSCKGIGKVANVAAIYELGYRVVSTVLLHESGMGTVVLIIEKTEYGKFFSNWVWRDR